MLQHKEISLLIIMSFLILLTVFIAVASSVSQLSFTLDLDNPVFRYEENALNSTNTSEDIIFSGDQNITVWITIPRNSSVLSSNFTLTGKITPTQSYGTGVAYYSVAVGNVTPDSENEIVIGRSSSIILLNSSLNEVCNFSTGSGIAYGVAIGNVTLDSGNDIAVGSQDTYVYLLNSTCDQNWTYSVGEEVKSVAIGDITSDPGEEIVAGTAASLKVYVFNSTGNIKWTYETSGTAYAVAVGDVTTETGNEIAVGDSTRVYLLNSTGNQSWNYTIGTIIRSITVGNVVSDSGEEVVAGANNGTVYLFNSTGNIKWTYDASDAVWGVSIGDITSDTGNEVAIGSADNKVYVLNSSGSFIWSYEAGNEVRDVDVGDINQNETTDPRNETVAVSIDRNVYVLNFEYYPTNVSLDIGNDGDYDWNYSEQEKLRTNVNVSNSTLAPAIQYYLDNDCTPQGCDVPFVFHSDAAGNLQISNINITYDYNASEAISYETVSAWSRTNNTLVNETIGNQVKNISYSTLTNDINISFIKIDDTATKCDFGGSSYSNITISGQNYCDVVDYILSSTVRSPDFLWDDTMSSDIAIYANESSPIEDGIYWKKNVTVWNDTTTTFYNVTLNTTLNKTLVKSEATLKVDWYSNGTFYDITPSSNQSDCNTSNPTYTNTTVGSDNFLVCKEDTDADGVVDFFKWKQPHTSTIVYEVRGVMNKLPTLENQSVTSGVWDSAFNFSIDVDDDEGDNVTVRLWVYIDSLGSWQKWNETNITGSGTVSFNLTSNKSWTGTGVNQYKFEYRDYNSTDASQVFHDWRNTTEYSGPNVAKHNVSIIPIQGNGTQVNRTGTNSTLLVVRVNDTNNASIVDAGVNCSFWITTDGSDFTLAHSSLTNSSGYCNYSFNPSSSYSVGTQWWNVTTHQDSYYETQSLVNFTVDIYGELNINLTSGVMDQNFTRGNNITLTAKLYDESGNDVSESGYNCTWYINNTEKGNSTTNTTGHCSYIWATNCSSTLATYLINVTLWGNASSYYTITKNESYTNVSLKGTLNVTIIYPIEGLIVHSYLSDSCTLSSINLNSTLVDDCGQTPTGQKNVTWYGNPCDGELATSENATWSMTYCGDSPCNQTIIVNATGDLYNTNEDNVSIYIYGWSQVSVLNNGTYNRSALGDNYTLVCFVKEHCVSGGVERYPVNFWYNKTGPGYTFLGKSATNSSGHATYEWHIPLNDTYPEGWYTIKCNITDNSTQPYPSYYNASVNESTSEIGIVGTGADLYPPEFIRVWADSVQPNNNVTINANITSLYNVDKVWVNLTFPNSSSFIHIMENTSTSQTRGVWNVTILNLSDVGDYDFTVFANNTADARVNKSSWFEVYLPLILFGNITNYDGSSNVTADFYFYRNGTNFDSSYLIHQFNTNSSWGYYNLTIYKRLYDLKVKLFNNTILFYDFNSTRTAEEQFNTTDINNITNPLNFTRIDAQSIYPDRRLYRLVAMDINSILVNGNITVTLNYSSVYGDVDWEEHYEEDVRITRCLNWSYSGSTCSGTWDYPNGAPNLTSHTVSRNVTNTSIYAAIEAVLCDNGRCQTGESCNEDYYCLADCGSCPTGGDTTGGGGGGGGGGAAEEEEEVISPEMMFSLRTNLTDVQLNPGDEGLYALWVSNNVNYGIEASISILGTISNFIRLENNLLSVATKAENITKIYVSIPIGTQPGKYTGQIFVTADNKTQSLPVTLTVSMKGTTSVNVVVSALTQRVGVNDTARFHVTLYNLGLWKKLNLNLTYSIKDYETEEVLYQEREEKTIETLTETFVKNIYLSLVNIEEGRYFFEVEVKYDNKLASDEVVFEVTKAFWTTERITLLTVVVVVTSSIIIFIYGRRRYIAWKLGKARYIFPIDFGKLPKGKLWVGKIAETNQKAYFKMNELKTHILTAGATGSGKSVSAMVFVEELLKEKIPVIVFDPTAQWSGFVNSCKDPNLLRYYKMFGMSKRDIRSYTGMIYEVTDPNVKIDFKKYMNPGEVTVFTLNKLKPGQYDAAVKNIINTIFEHGWEESTELKMVVVFDEVHRLLEKYGGKGGYVDLERACREFRKWGIGLIMASQVLSDFKEAIKGNVLTEIQLHTKSLGDLRRVEKKYGLDYTKRVTKLEIGVGMMQNPRYNEGRPFFVSFRPTYHEPHKIPDEDMKMYREYAAMLSEIESKIEKLEEAGKDVFDLRTEFKLAMNKLKRGRFRMAKIYIDSLSKHLSGE